MVNYSQHPALTAIKAKSFPYSGWMYPKEFANYYLNLPVVTPGGKLLQLSCIRYCSGLRSPRLEGRIAWRKAVTKYFDSKGWDPAVKSWIETDRTASVFAGHGLPEELSLACRLALDSGYKTESTLQDWAREMLGIDCNGFVNAYLTSLGLFSKPLHKHPAYLNVSPPAQSDIEIDADSVIVTAIGSGPGHYRVKDNPSEKGAHILIVNGWKGDNLEVTDQAGLHTYDGPLTSEFRIIKAPPPDTKLPLDRVFTICKKGNDPDKYSKLVYITRPMQSY